MLLLSGAASFSCQTVRHKSSHAEETIAHQTSDGKFFFVGVNRHAARSARDIGEIGAHDVKIKARVTQKILLALRRAARVCFGGTRELETVFLSHTR